MAMSAPWLEQSAGAPECQAFSSSDVIYLHNDTIVSIPEASSLLILAPLHQ